ncbi:hypothetical protein [Methylomonas sp. AM2-LC]|uniref:hypothetical protein n=1 Tax=Methylomonas sp. AM2-LC TaxID=3153301 RepID=UPI003266ABE1
MSESFSVTSGNSFKDDGYTIKKIMNCRIVYGAVPISEFAMLTQGYSKKAILSSSLASRIGATFVIGEPEDIDLLSQSTDLPVSESRQIDVSEAKLAGLPETIITWLKIGERGLSSDAMCKAFFGIPSRAGVNHPHDPDDFKRCMGFLNSVPSSDKWRMNQLPDLSKEWKFLSNSWLEIEKCLLEELVDFKDSTGKTYNLMNKILNGKSDT